MMRHTGIVCAGLGLLWLGPSFAQELRTPAQDRDSGPSDPLTDAWFDTVQSIGVLEGLSRQLDVRRPGAIDNLRRNTELPIVNDVARGTRLEELEREIARLRSELELLESRDNQVQPAPQAEPTPIRSLPVTTRTVGLTDAQRAALLGTNRPATNEDAPITGDDAEVTLVLGPLGAVQGEAPQAMAEPAPTSHASEFESTGSGPIDALETTLILAPLEGPTADAGAPTAAPTIQGAEVQGQPAGTGPVADRVRAAEQEAARRAEAERLAEQRAETVPGYSADAMRQGRAAYFAGQYERAVELLAPHSERFEALYWQGRSLEKLDRNEEAIKAYERVQAAQEAGEFAERARLDLEFLRWRIEHERSFKNLRDSLEQRNNG